MLVYGFLWYTEDNFWLQNRLQSFIQYNILNNIYAVHIKYGGSGNGNGAYLILKLYG